MIYTNFTTPDGPITCFYIFCYWIGPSPLRIKVLQGKKKSLIKNFRLYYSFFLKKKRWYCVSVFFEILSSMLRKEEEKGREEGGEGNNNNIMWKKKVSNFLIALTGFFFVFLYCFLVLFLYVYSVWINENVEFVVKDEVNWLVKTKTLPNNDPWNTPTSLQQVLSTLVLIAIYGLDILYIILPWTWTTSISGKFSYQFSFNLSLEERLVASNKAAAAIVQGLYNTHSGAPKLLFV